MLTDADLMRAHQLGDKNAFEELINRHQNGLLNFFYRLVHDRELAEDHTQEVFLKIYLHADSYRQEAKFTTYLYRVAKNCWIDQLRKTKRRGYVHSLDKEFENGVNLYERLAADTKEPGARLEEKDRAAVIEEAIQSLPEEQRVVFVLAEVQEMKYADIAETLDVPVGTVKSRMHVATRRLRELLENKGLSI